MSKKCLISAKNLFPKEDNRETRSLRVFPHKRNQFLIHLFAKLENKNEEFLNDFCEDFENEFSGKRIEFLKERHLSLINGFFCLKYHEIQSFVQTIESKIESKEIIDFPLCLHSFDLFRSTNRLFVVIKQTTPEKTTTVVTNALKDFQMAKVGVSPEVAQNEYRLHVSLASLSPEDQSLGEELIESMNKRLEKPLFQRISEIYLKIGEFSKRLVLSKE